MGLLPVRRANRLDSPWAGKSEPRFDAGRYAPAQRPPLDVCKEALTTRPGAGTKVTRRSHSVTDGGIMALNKSHGHAGGVHSEAASDLSGPPWKPRHQPDSMHGATSGQMRPTTAARETTQPSSAESVAQHCPAGPAIPACAPEKSRPMSRSSWPMTRAWNPRRRRSSCPTGHRRIRPPRGPIPTLLPAERRRFSQTRGRCRPWPPAGPRSARLYRRSGRGRRA